MSRNENILGVVFVTGTLFAGLAAAGFWAGEEKTSQPAGFEQIVPRGAIASVDNPEFVEAGEADISPDSWVLGVVIEGEARAYSLSLLNHHEVVNDRIGDQAIAAVW